MTPEARDQMVAMLRQARQEIRPFASLNAESIHLIIDAVLVLVAAPPEPGPDVFDELYDLEERRAIQGEPPSVYWWLKHPIL